MGAIRWDEDLTTGDGDVDRQHRAIHALLSELETADDNRATLQSALEALAEHVLVHFATEEDLMRRSGFPSDQIEVHVREHEVFLNGIRTQILAFRTGDLVSVAPIVKLLREWLFTHVHDSDARLVEFLNAHGYSKDLGGGWSSSDARLGASA